MPYIVHILNFLGDIMRNDIAIGIKPGDTVYNCFMEPLIVQYKINGTLDLFPDDRCTKLIVKDSNDQQHEYDCEDLYLTDLADEDDAEKSWVLWAKDNKDFFDTFDHITTTKEIYKTAFYNGFEHKKRYSYSEQLQK